VRQQGPGLTARPSWVATSLLVQPADLLTCNRHANFQSFTTPSCFLWGCRSNWARWQQLCCHAHALHKPVAGALSAATERVGSPQRRAPWRPPCRSRRRPPTCAARRAAAPPPRPAAPPRTRSPARGGRSGADPPACGGGPSQGAGRCLQAACALVCCHRSLARFLHVLSTTNTHYWCKPGPRTAGMHCDSGEPVCRQPGNQQGVALVPIRPLASSALTRTGAYAIEGCCSSAPYAPTC